MKHSMGTLIFQVILSMLCVLPLETAVNFCSRSVNYKFYTSCVDCQTNKDVDCPAGTRKLTSGKGVSDCTFYVKTFLMTGCRHRCHRDDVIKYCCKGYWGQECLACPGGADTPCNERGLCSEGIDGLGFCDCDPGFTGTACEMCANSTMYGPNCNEECLCVNGMCSSGIHGNGSCDCYSGYSGVFCDEYITGCENVTCGNSSRCLEIDGNVTCVCDIGYESDGNGSCIPIDTCRSSPCGQFAVCESTGPGHYNCSCQSGYLGDGKICEAINPCRINHGGCVINSSSCMYISPNKSQCDCNSGYENYQPGVGCSLIDVCKLKPNQCHPNATCQTTGPNEFNCTCNPGFAGDGKQKCYGNILLTLKDINANHPVLKSQLTFIIKMFETIYKEPITEHGPFTVFASNDRGFKTVFKTGTFESFLSDEDRARQVLRQHMIIGELTLQTLLNHTLFYTLQGVTAELVFKARNDVFKYRIHGSGSKAKILQGNIMAANGIIHVTNTLLTVQPNVVGNTEENLLTLIKAEGRYRRFLGLISFSGMERVFQKNNITAFVPSNGILDGLPEGTLTYLQSNDGKEKLRTILENHVYEGKIPVADLINRRQIRSVAGFSTSISVTDVGQIRLNRNVNISQSDIPCQGGLYYHVENVLAPPEIGGILPHRCDIKTNRTVRGSCSICYGNLKCPGPSDIPLNNIMSGCRYWVRVDGQLVVHIGCARMCVRTYTTRKCCDGFYSFDCLPCPGGFQKPCNNHGKCFDGYYGNGTCACHKDFMGRSCERCSQRNMFGPGCNQTCTCLFGKCIEGPQGSGICKPHSCQLGYFGKNCDQKRVKCGQAVTLCHAHSTCFEDGDEFRCQCKPGYEGDGLTCTEIDPCLKPDRGGCHIQATCTKVGPDMPRCTCNEGWVGDGFSCYLASPCMNSYHCHDNAICRSAEAGKSVCVCVEGYFGNGTFCKPTNSCIENNGGCSVMAQCIYVGPGENNCSCVSGYEGDGFSCYSSIAQQIQDNSSHSVLATLLKLIDPEDNFLLYPSSNYTFFAPVDEALLSFKSKSPDKYWTNAENILTFLRFHTLPGIFTIQNLLALETSYGKFPTMYDGYSIRIVTNNQSAIVFSSQLSTSRIISHDIVALNGLIHTVDKVLEPLLPEDDLPDLDDFFTTHSEYSLFSQWLSKKGLIDSIQNMDEYTLFAPNNQAMLNINRTVTTDFLKYYIVPKILLSASITDGQTEESVLGFKHQLQFQTRNGEVYVNSILIADPDHLTDGGIIHGISTLLHPVLNKCVKTTTKTTLGLCSSCNNQPEQYKCPAGFKRIVPQVIIRYRCQYNLRLQDGNIIPIAGCAVYCEKINELGDCCAGHFGPECKECPGGPEVPCSGHGRCNDGYGGNGLCICEENFWGLKCNLCTKGLAGPFCNVSKNTCDFNNGNCSDRATCEMVEDEITCRCYSGYLGDGHVCYSPCDSHNGGCHADASCLFLSQSVYCKCLPGFHGNGTFCQPVVDLCVTKKNICSPFASCSFTPPNASDVSEGTVQCQCKKGFVGNGSICNKDVLDALSHLTGASEFYKKILSLDDDDILKKMLGNPEENITMFVPVNLKDTTAKQMTSFDMKTHIVNYTKIYINSSLDVNISFVSDAGKSLTINISNDQFWVNDIKVVDLNIPALNGYIHFIESPLWFWQKPKEASSSKSKLSAIIGPIIGVLVFLVILVIVVAVIVYHRSEKTGFLDILNRFRKDSDGSLLFSRLSNSQDDDDDEPLPVPFALTDNVNFDNPIFTTRQTPPD